MTIEQELWKKQWRSYVVRFASKQGLVDECLAGYESYCDQSKYSSDVVFDYEFYANAADCALYDWDI